jgi:hypothetical protein
MPAGYDAEVAELFRDLRAASGMSETDLAAQLATRLEVVQALEQGAIYALPPWPETCRVISTYGTLLNLDVRPLLRRIYAQVEAGIVELAPKPLPDVPFMAPPQDGMGDMRTGARQQGQRMAEPFPAAPIPPSRQPRPPQTMPDGRPSPRQGGQQSRAPQPRQQPQDFPERAAARAMTPPPQQRSPQPAPDPRVRSQPQALAQQQAKAGSPKAKGQKARSMPQPQRKKRRGLLKWGIAALLASAAAFGLWMWMSYPGLFGSFGPAAQSGGEGSPPAATADPNDPRSRKADRLPSPPS